MLNFFALTTEADRKEAAAIDRRRAFDQERMKRIFDPKQRRFGIDFQVLSQQVEEKKKREEDERLIDQAYHEQFKKTDAICVALEKQEQEERMKLQQEINNFRRCCQRPEDRREFDLNDPDFMKKMKPARASIDDPSLGVSAAQKMIEKINEIFGPMLLVSMYVITISTGTVMYALYHGFEGEDEHGDERSQLQKEQIKAWLGQQMMAKEAADKERKAADEAYLIAVKARDERALELEAMEKECRRRIDDACRRFNKALADEKKMEGKKRAKQEYEDSLAEMYNFMTSDMLTENPEVANSNLGPGRQIGYLYKGMTPEQKLAVIEYQKSQIEENRKRRELEARRDREMDAYMDGTQQTISQMDKNIERQKRLRDKELAEENRKLAEEQKLRRQYMDKIVYNNRATEEFYAQFNKSGR